MTLHKRPAPRSTDEAVARLNDAKASLADANTAIDDTITMLTGSEPEPPEPPEVSATTAVAGTPGTFLPPGSTPPPDDSDLSGLTAEPTDPWQPGEHVILGDASHVHWVGAAWASGDAP